MRSIGRWLGAAVLVAGVACGRSDVQTSSGGSTSTGGSTGGSGGGGNSGTQDGGSGVTDGGGGTGGGTGGGQDGGTGGTGGSGTDGGAGGGTDGGTGGGTDAGQDGGTGGGQDGGTGGTDAGTLATFDFPTTPGWQFFGPTSGGPQDVYDLTFDEGGNLWVAGGSEGLFLMRADASGNLSGTFQKFGIAEGLHPYGWVNGDVAKALGVPDGSPADTHPSLDTTPVISVAGGPAGTVFVGYQGKPGCSDAWTGNQWQPATMWGDPSIYKSGDADRVTLAGSGITVVHYDIFTGPNVIVPAEPMGREKVCTVYRMAWDKASNTIWFGGNHGFAVGRADAQNVPTCNGQTGCSPVWEHSHPAFNGCSINYDFAGGAWCPKEDAQVYLTDSYYGVAIDPTNHDMWFGGVNRTTKFHSGTYGGASSFSPGAYYKAYLDVESYPDYQNSPLIMPGVNGPCPNTSPVCGMADRWDLWPDAEPEWDSTHGPIYVSPAMRGCVQGKGCAFDDNVFGIAGLPDGTAWVGGMGHGLIRIDSAGHRLADASSQIRTPYVSSVALDPKDGSIWAGMQYGFDISRIGQGGGLIANYDDKTFGDKLVWAPVSNIQGNARHMAVGFHQFTDPSSKIAYAGAIAIYSGQ